MPLAILFSTLVSSCATPPDIVACVELEPNKGWCTFSISNQEFFIDDTHPWQGKTWKQINDTSLRVPATSWAQLKAYILKICKKNQDCANNIGTWQRKADKIDQSLSPASPTPSPTPTGISEEQESDFAFKIIRKNK